MSESANQGHNAASRANTIRDTCRKLAELEARRDEIGEQIRALRQVAIKGDLGMKIADFNAVYRLYSLEDEARDAFLDVLKETFEALGVGSQLSFLDVIGSKRADVADPAPAPEAAPAAPAEPKRRGRPPKARANGDGQGAQPTEPATQAGEAAAGGYTYEVGREAGRSGAKADQNPHPAGTLSAEEWKTGWLAGQSEIVHGTAGSA